MRLPDVSAKRMRQLVLEIGLDAWKRKVQEHPNGSNRGPDVDRYNRLAGAELGSPWCAAFMHACWYDAANRMNMACPIPPNASSSWWYRWGRDKGCLTNNPVPGDIGLVPGGATGHRHTLMLKGRLGPLARTLEGNGNAAGSADGGAVVLRWRKIKSLDWVHVPID